MTHDESRPLLLERIARGEQRLNEERQRQEKEQLERWDRLRAVVYADVPADLHPWFVLRVEQARQPEVWLEIRPPECMTVLARFYWRQGDWHRCMWSDSHPRKWAVQQRPHQGPADWVYEDCLDVALARASACYGEWQAEQQERTVTDDERQPHWLLRWLNRR